VAQRIADLSPELLILSTSHGELYRDALRISTGEGASGDFSQFRDPADRLEVAFDESFIDALVAEATAEGIPFDASPEPGNNLDHGSMVPLYFITQHLHTPFRVVRIAISFLDEHVHYRMGQCVARAVATTKRQAVFVASGDLSHRLKKDGPYGFNPAGPKFDEAICRAFAAGDFDALTHFDARLRDDAGECGLNSFIIMAGALDGREVKPKLLSYEGPWGVGYGIARFTPNEPVEAKGAGAGGRFEAGAEGAGAGESTGAGAEGAGAAEGVESAGAGADVEAGADMEAADVKNATVSSSSSLPVQIAFAALADWLSGNKKPSATTAQVASLLESLDDADRTTLATLNSRHAGTFVSFHKGADLRGCIGTISATCSNIFEEICQNTVSAAGHDPRFPAIRADEVAKLSCSVDILGEAEPTLGTDELDAKRYGVIVSKGFRRGLLLPDLEGVDTPAEQIDIALRKAGIAPDESYELERFEVVRYE
jgi:AmmeMemoRadiSam system protein A